jgi:hypothetical protein
MQDRGHDSAGVQLSSGLVAADLPGARFLCWQRALAGHGSHATGQAARGVWWHR